MTSVNNNYNSNVHDDHSEDMPKGNTQAGITPKTGFSFLKKAKAKNESEGNTQVISNNGMNTVPDSKSELSDSHHDGNSSKSARNENKSTKTGFNFIKKANPVDLNKNEGNHGNNKAENQCGTSHNESINNQNNYNYLNNQKDTSNKLTLDNLLSESDNIFNIIQKDIDSSYLSGKNNISDIHAENINSNEVIPIDHADEINANRENDFNNSLPAEQTENKPKKGGFNFVKKKAEPQNPQEKETLNKENLNLNQFNDLNSDTKSFRSLKINSNMMHDNISVNLDEGSDNKSCQNINKIISSHSLTNVSNLKNSLTNRDKKENKDNNQTDVVLDPELLKKKYYDELLKTLETAKELILQSHSLKTKNKSKEEDLKHLDGLLDELALKEEDAINNNDFDSAQSIENKISEIKKEINEINTSIIDLDKEKIEIREQELHLIKNKTKLLDDTFNAFNKLKKSGEYELEILNSTEMSKHKNDNIRIKKLKEKLDFLKSNLDSDKLYIDDEEAKITKVIKSQSSGVFDELDELNEQKSEILKEIDKLKKLLEEKCAELDIVEKSIESKEIEIDAIKSNFNHEFNKIHFKKKYYEDNLKDYSEQFSHYENLVKAYTMEENKFEEKSKKLKNELSNLENEMEKFKSELTCLDEDFNKKEYLLNNESEIRSKIHLTEMCLQNKNIIINKNSEAINNLEVNIKKLEAEIATNDMKMPALEEEKKSFVIAKNFKEAGKVSNELKSILENKTKNLTIIDGNKNRILDLKSENEKSGEELIKIKEQKLEEEKELSLTRYEYLIMHRDNLESMKVLFSEKLDLRDNELSSIESEIEFLHKEIDSLENIDYIIEKFALNRNKEVYIAEENKEDDIEIQSENSKENEDRDDSINNEQEDNEEHNEENNNAENQDDAEVITHEDSISLKNEINKEEIKTKLAELDQMLQSCIEQENFEKADEIQQEIDELSKLIEN